MAHLCFTDVALSNQVGPICVNFGESISVSAVPTARWREIPIRQCSDPKKRVREGSESERASK